MFKHILVPTDGSELSNKAVKQAIEFAKAVGARVTGFHVTPEFPLVAYSDWGPIDPITESRFREEAEKQAEKLLAAFKEQAQAAGVACDTRNKTSDRPYEAIIDAALEQGCDLIFMASHGRRGLAGLLMGSETTKVLTHSTIPVLVYR